VRCQLLARAVRSKSSYSRRKKRTVKLEPRNPDLAADSSAISEKARRPGFGALCFVLKLLSEPMAAITCPWLRRPRREQFARRGQSTLPETTQGGLRRLEVVVHRPL
jgi:hypothetical protein